MTTRTQAGYITLLSVLVLAAVAGVVTTSIMLTGMNASRTTFASQQSLAATALADACAEIALQEIRDDQNYSGTGTTTYSAGECNYEVVSTGGQNRTVRATGIVGTMTKKMVVTVDAINPVINVASWQEVSDF